jgi:hypothetical protein
MISMRAPLAPSRPLALVLVVALGALVAWALVSESARVALRTPLVPREARPAPVAVPLDGRETPRGTSLFRIELTAADPAALLAHDELQLFLDSEPRAELRAARLEWRGTRCSLAAEPGAELTSRQAVALRRGGGCQGAASAAPAALDLLVEARGRPTVTLLAFEAAGLAAIAVAPSRARSVPLPLRGAWVDYPPRAPRVELLGHMWRAAGSGWLLACVGLAVLLAGAGCLVFPTRAVPAGDGRPAAPLALRASLGAACLAGSLGLLYAVLTPPLSGPDEPYHLLGFAALANDEALAADTVRLMGETHLWRIRQQPGERFRTIDVGRPYVVEDDQLRPTEVAQRSAIVAWLWRAVLPIAQGKPAPQALLALRLVNVAVFALAVGLAMALALLVADEPWRQWLVYPFFFVPALPFFATHVSETAVLCAVYVLLATSLALLCLDGPRARWAGLALGLATGLMLAGGRSPWPLATLVAATLAGRIALASRGAARPGRDALVFWGGFGLGTTVFWLVIDEPYRRMTESYALRFAFFVPESVRHAVVWLLTRPQVAALAAAAGWALERLLTRPRERVAAGAGVLAARLVPWATAALSLGVVLSLLGSLVLRYPQLPTESIYSMPMSDRVAAVLATMATLFRLDQPNFLLASSFWVGFGWLDTMPGAALQGLLVAVAGLGLVALLRDIGRRRDVRRFLWLLVFAVGAALSLVVYTLAMEHHTSPFVGRHLIGWYLALLAVTAGSLTLERWTAAAHGAHGDAPRGGGRASVLLALAGAVHVYCLWFVLQRYF